MLKRPRIHLVTRDKSLAAELSMALVQMGYAISGIDDSILMLKSDIGAKLLIVDTRNQDETDALTHIDLPIIQLLNPDDPISTIANEKQIAQLSSPFSKEKLKQQLDLLIPNINELNFKEEANAIKKEVPLKLNDRLFVRHKEKMVKLEIEQILYIEADRNYSRIFSKDKEYMVAITLKTMEAKLPDNGFFRIHRSYIVNLRQIDEVAETHLVIARKALPISKTLRAGLMKRLQTI